MAFFEGYCFACKKTLFFNVTTPIEIRDDGPSIPDSEKERVLKPFYRGDMARDFDEGKSFGLGLLIVRSVIVAHHGQVELLDVKPTGPIARLTLPTGR